MATQPPTTTAISISMATEPSIWSTSIPNRSPELVIVSIVFLAITTLFFVTRLAWRFTHAQRGWDDLMASLAYATLVVQSTFGFISAHYGFGKHRANLPPEMFGKAMFWFWLYQICYKLIGGFTKLNFCLLYLRIFAVKKFQRAVWVVTGVIAAGTIAFTVGTILQCIPINRNWDRRIDGYCISYMAFWFSHAAFNTFMDIIVYILPIPLIRTLQMAKKTKTGLFAIFALGAFTIAASIVRMVMLRGSAKSTQDPTWGSMSALVWTEIEANTAVICCCLPALRTLGVRIWRGVRGKSGPETEERSGDGDGQQSPKPQGRRSKFLGNFVSARYSPPNTADDAPMTMKDIPKRSASKRRSERWLQKILPTNLATINDEQQEEGCTNTPDAMQKTVEFDVQSARESLNLSRLEPRTEEVFPTRPESDLTFEEMLRRGPPGSPSPGRR